MTVQKILVVGDDGDEMLRKVCREIDKLREDIQQVIVDLKDTSEVIGLGLAASQIGEDLRMFVMQRHKDKPIVFINPVIVKKSGKRRSYDEGCLSVPNNRYTVKRPKSVTMRAVGEDGQPFIYKSRSKLEAAVMQHEMDHLNGILIDER